MCGSSSSFTADLTVDINTQCYRQQKKTEKLDNIQTINAVQTIINVTGELQCRNLVSEACVNKIKVLWNK